MHRTNPHAVKPNALIATGKDRRIEFGGHGAGGRGRQLAKVLLG